jgi:hypothetical protein
MTDGNEITAAMVRDLYEAEWHDEPVISRDAGGWHRVEPEPAATAAGREVVFTASALDVWSQGRPLAGEEFAALAAALNVPDD